MKKDFDKIRHYFFLAVLIAVTFWLFWIVRPFLYPLFWAMVLAWLFYPMYLKVYRYFKPNKGIASFLTVSLIFVLFLIPFLGILSLIVQQSIVLYRYSSVEVGKMYDQLKSIAQLLGSDSVVQFSDTYGIDVKEKVVEGLQIFANTIQVWITNFTKGTIRTIIGFLIMMYSLYYFFKDGDVIAKKILRLSPLAKKDEKFIYGKFASTIRATLKGTLLVALIQGGIAALTFWIAGVVAPFFWGMIMIILALIPVVGPGLLAFPTGIILLFTGKIWQGFLVLSVGVFLVSIIDNILRPYLVGRDIEIHPLLIFFSTIGGLAVLGPAGFIIGPIVASICVSLWHMYEKEYKTNLDKN